MQFAVSAWALTGRQCTAARVQACSRLHTDGCFWALYRTHTCSACTPCRVACASRQPSTSTLPASAARPSSAAASSALSCRYTRALPALPCSTRRGAAQGKIRNARACMGYMQNYQVILLRRLVRMGSSAAGCQLVDVCATKAQLPVLSLLSIQRWVSSTCQLAGSRLQAPTMTRTPFAPFA